mmetsp:Transcript_39182/g.81959  ORF Transcript_39182/g.81959 Transcript_39182/m.81959 type:complete len:128 (+) Transcript_39182:208-591(+)
MHDLVSLMNARLPAQQSQCQYGYGAVLPTDDCVLFKVLLEAGISKQIGDGKSIIEALIRSFQMADNSFPEILDDHNARESMKSVYLAAGTKCILAWEANRCEQIHTIYCAGVLIFLEEHEGLDFKAC